MGATCSTDKITQHQMAQGNKSKSVTPSRLGSTSSNLTVLNNNSSTVKLSESSFYMTAKRSIKKGDFDGAKKNLKTAIAAEPTNFYYYYLLGKILYEESNLEEALVHLNKAHELKSTDLHTIITLVNAHVMNYDYDQAIKLLEKGFEIAPNDLDIQFLGAMINELTENFDLSNNLYNSVLVNHTSVDRVFVLCKLAMNCLKLNQRDRAQAYFKKARAIDLRHSMVCCYYVYRTFFDCDYLATMQYCKTYNTMHFKYADANRSELWFMWALSYKYRTQQVKINDELDYLSDRKTNYFKRSSEIEQERRKKMVFNRLGTMTSIELGTLPTLSGTKTRNASPTKPMLDGDSRNINKTSTSLNYRNSNSERPEEKLEFNEVFRPNYFSRCLVNACKEKPYNYRILLYSITYFLDNDVESLALIIKENLTRLVKDFRRQKAPLEFLNKISEKLDIDPELKEEINALIIEVYGYTPAVVIDQITTLVKTGELEEADKLIISQNVEKNNVAAFYYFNGLKSEKANGKYNEEAIEWYKKSFDKNANNPSVVKRLVAYHTNQKNISGAIAVYEKAIQVPDVDILITYHYAVFLFHNVDKHMSLPLFRKLHESNPDYHKVKYYCEELFLIVSQGNDISEY